MSTNPGTGAGDYTPYAHPLDRDPYTDPREGDVFHLASGERPGNGPACGADPDWSWTTGDPEAVTCPSCQRHPDVEGAASEQRTMVAAEVRAAVHVISRHGMYVTSTTEPKMTRLPSGEIHEFTADLTTDPRQDWTVEVRLTITRKANR